MADALIEDGFMPFIAAGIKLDEDGVPVLRLAGEVTIVRRLEDEAWAMIRETLFGAIDALHADPLDDLEMRSYHDADDAPDS